VVEMAVSKVVEMSAVIDTSKDIDEGRDVELSMDVEVFPNVDVGTTVDAVTKMVDARTGLLGFGMGNVVGNKGTLLEPMKGSIGTN
jgi:predicted transcriptional regulator